MTVFGLFLLISVASAGVDKDVSHKGQFCTDPRTMRKHAAYSEWADAYSCTRHRCQPGGRNLAIYTVGCKRVEAPESAIECEEVVEDTNMQFPYCCTRLRCLVVVRGEVWTRVLGQPWETLPAAPWSHMYKMKKPPPGDNFLPKSGEGPVYELLSEHNNQDEDRPQQRSHSNTDSDKEAPAVPGPTPDIVIALTDDKMPHLPHTKSEEGRHRIRKTTRKSLFDDLEIRNGDDDLEPTTEKVQADRASDEKYFSNNYGFDHKLPKIQSMQAWTEPPPNPWVEQNPASDFELLPPQPRTQPLQQADTLVSEPKASNLQALVDAIGTRMRDIENVVQRMSEKVHQAKPSEPDFSSVEKNTHRTIQEAKRRMKKPNLENEHYNRFTNRQGSKYVHGLDVTTDPPLFVEDSNMNGYFSDASNSVVRRNLPKEPPPATYMAPIENRHKLEKPPPGSEETEKKHKKRSHKRKHQKGHHKKRHGKEDKRKSYNKLNSLEVTDLKKVSAENASSFGLRDDPIGAR